MVNAMDEMTRQDPGREMGRGRVGACRNEGSLSKY